MKSTIIVILLFVSTLSWCQNVSDGAGTVNNDSFSETVKADNLPELVTQLTQNCTTELEKARAIFVWMTHNIRYDYKLFYKRRPKIFKCKEKSNCDQQRAEWERQFVEKTFRKRRGICSGYAQLYQSMCRMANIECTVINGYIKNAPSQIGRMGILDHAWNAIVIDGNYYYLDATWGAGYCTVNKRGKMDGFVYHFDDYYWLTPVDKFSRNHFPKDTMQLVNSTYSKQLFRNNPYIENKVLPKIEIVAPETGIINAHICDTIKFAFHYPKTIAKLQVNSNVERNPRIENKNNVSDRILKRQKYTDFKKEGDLYTFEYTITDRSVRFIEILFDYKLALKYLVKVVPEKAWP